MFRGKFQRVSNDVASLGDLIDFPEVVHAKNLSRACEVLVEVNPL